MLIGREKEKAILLDAFRSDESEFVAVYGRRRVGKTYLIREAFNYLFAFQHTGILGASLREELSELTLTDFTLHFSCTFTKLLHSHFIPLLNDFTVREKCY